MLLVLMYMSIASHRELTGQLVVCVGYTLLFGFINCLCWRYTALKKAEWLTYFYLLSMVTKLLTACAAIVVYSLCIDRKEEIVAFVAMFSIFLVLTIVLDTLFFYNIEKNNAINKLK